MPDYYEVLGITKSATKEEVKKAYRKAALRTHPDRAPPDQKKKAEDAFRAVNAAYEVLYDDANRAHYDKYGSWPPPAASEANASKSRSRPNPTEYKPFTQPVYEPENGTHHHFVFTDPFALFNMIFADLMQPRVAAFHGRHTRTPVPMFDPTFAPPFLPFGSFPPPPPQPAFTASAPPPATNPTASTSQSESHSSPGDSSSGWIKESRVTKMTPQGTRETTIKKTAPDGTVYITRIAGDGTERHFISINGIEKPSTTPPPAIAPAPRIPLSQTQPQGNSAAQSQPNLQPQPKVDIGRSHSRSGRHTSSASQPVVSVHHRDSPPADQQKHGQPYAAAPPPPSNEPPPSHRRSASRGPAFTSNYRVASPPPMPKENNPGSYPFAYAQAPQPRHRPTTPVGYESDASRAPRSDPRDPRRHHTAPASSIPTQNVQPPMPRPQSPHFYRSRVTSQNTQPQPGLKLPSQLSQEVRGEAPAYVLSDSEAGRRPSAYRPSRSTQSYPVPAPSVDPQYGASIRRPPSRQPQHQLTQSQRVPQPAQPAQTSHIPMPINVPVTNELGLGFVPPPSAGLTSHASHISHDYSTSSRNATYNATHNNARPNPPLTSQSRSGSYEEIVYGQHKSRSSTSGMAYNPYQNQMPSGREPWPAQSAYRQAA